MISVRTVVPWAVTPKNRSIIACPRGPAPSYRRRPVSTAGWIPAFAGMARGAGRRPTHQLAPCLGGCGSAELIGEHLFRHFFDRATREMAELERPISKADQPGDRIPEMFENPADLAVLALLQRQGDP